MAHQRQRAPRAHDILAELMDELRREVEAVAELLADEREATHVEAGDILAAWEIVLATSRGLCGRRPR